jgi:hypothetical protein
MKGSWYIFKHKQKWGAVYRDGKIFSAVNIKLGRMQIAPFLSTLCYCMYIKFGGTHFRPILTNMYLHGCPTMNFAE